MLDKTKSRKYWYLMYEQSSFLQNLSTVDMHVRKGEKKIKSENSD